MEKKGLIFVPVIFSSDAYTLYEGVEGMLSREGYRIFNYTEISGDKAAGVQVNYLHDGIMTNKDKIGFVGLDLIYETKFRSGERLRDAGYEGYILLHDLDGQMFLNKSRSREILEDSGDDIMVDSMRDIPHIVRGVFSDGVDLNQLQGSIVYNPDRFKQEGRILVPTHTLEQKLDRTHT